MPSTVIRAYVIVCAVLCIAGPTQALYALQDRPRSSEIAARGATRADSLRELRRVDGAASRTDSATIAAQAAATSAAIASVITVGSRGITFSSPDASTKLTLRARIQNSAEITTVSTDDFAARDMSMAPRRVRLRLDGSVLDPRLSIKLQLSFTRRDQDFDDTQAPNVVRDAVAYWRFNPSFQIGFGQTKLPGNRQRVVSSGDLQFAERSIVNNRFTYDRDQGIFTRFDHQIGRARMNLQYAISLGEGRNQPTQKAGIANTARVELLPLGAFTEGGDYFEGDVLRERSPKISFGASYGTNSRSSRTGGQLGSALWSPVSFETVYIDGLFKYRGFAAYSEFAARSADAPVTTKDGAPNRYVYTGTGRLFQASYFLHNWEPAVRYAQTSPDRAILGEIGAVVQEHRTLGITRYFNRHRVRLQGEITHNATRDPFSGLRASNFVFRLNSEVGI